MKKIKKEPKKQLTEDDIINHVQTDGKYYGSRVDGKDCYCVRWGAKMFHAFDTRDLVLQICKYEKVRVKE